MRTEAGDIVLALDAMGGDHGPSVILPGAARALEMRPELRFVIFGDLTAIENELTKLPALHARSTVHHTQVAIAMDDKPSQAIRKGRKTSSMWQTVDAVKTGEAQAAVSAGNTGALMAMAKVILKTIDGVSRPAIAAIWPTLRGRSVVLDVGATVGAVTEQLVANSVMGAAMARCLFGVRNPSVGLLNIGVEEVKGVESVREAGTILREAELPLTYAGFIEGSDIGKGTTDVVVTEGFSGNIALKTAEGTAVQVATVLKEELRGGLLSKLGAFFALKALRNFKSRLDPRRHNGGVFLGLNGVVVKSHGGIDAKGVASAVNVAADMVENDLVDRIIKGMELAHPETQEDEQDRSQA